MHFDFWQELWLRAPLTVVLSILGAVISSVVTFGVGLYLRDRHQRYLRAKLLSQLEQGERAHGERAIVMVLSVITRIKEAAQHYMKEHGREGLRLVEIHEEQALDKDRPEAWSDYLERVKEEIREARETGVQRIYLFAQLPVAMAAIAGAAFLNGPEVIVHHYQQGKYYQVGRIVPETVRF